MARILFAIPGDLAAPTGGYGYDRRMLEWLPRSGLETLHVELPGGFPAPSAADVTNAIAQIRQELRSGDVVLIDGLAFGAMPEAAVSALGAPIVALCHHPLYLETGIGRARADALRESERRALLRAAHIVATSAFTRARLAEDLQIPQDRISVAFPGTDPAPRAKGSRGPVTLLAVGALTPRKAFHLLVLALAELSALNWRLRLIGSHRHAPKTADALKTLIASRALENRIELPGEVPADELDRAYDTSDVFVSSSLYEGYGMALAEALARGLPIVTSTGGAAAETVPDGAALKVAPGDISALRDALRLVISDAELRSRLGEESWRAGKALPSWEDSARVIADVVRALTDCAT